MLRKEPHETNKQYLCRVLAHSMSLPLLSPGDMEKISYRLMRPVETNEEMWGTLDYWKRNGITEVAVDTEFEMHLHYKGLEQLCLVQVFDGTNYFLIDGLKLTQQCSWNHPLKVFFESKDLKKVMFSALNDAVILRKHGIILNNAFDVQNLGNFLSAPTFSLVACLKMFLGVTVMGGKEVSASPVVSPATSPSVSPTGSPTASQTLCSAGPEAAHKPLTASKLKAAKKKKQLNNWVVRPVGVDEAMYALSDVEYLFKLRDVMLGKLRALDAKMPGTYDRAVKSAVVNNGRYACKPAAQSVINHFLEKSKIKEPTKGLVLKVYNCIVRYSRMNLVSFDTIVPDHEVFVQTLAYSFGLVMVNKKSDLAQVFRDLLAKFGSTLSKPANDELADMIAAKVKKSKMKGCKKF